MRDLLRRLLFVVTMLLVCRVGTYIVLPGINPGALAEFTKANASGVLGMFNMFTGGALGRMSIFALNIMPYITASIIMQLVTTIFNGLKDLKEQGQAGRKKIGSYTRYLAIVLTIFQAYGIAVGVENLSADGMQLVIDPGFAFRAIATLSMLGGTMFVLWLTDQISQRGIGNGSSLVIFTGIVVGLPGALKSLFEMGYSGALSIPVILIIFIMATALTTLIVFFERSQRKVTVQYPKRQVGRKIVGGDSTHLPLKLNTAGVLGPIFASSLLLFPSTIITLAGKGANVESWYYKILLHLGHGKPLYIVLYIVLIMFFSFFYAFIIFNPQETAENLKKAGAIIPGRRPGEQTASYLRKILERLTVIGSCYLAFICVVPELLISAYSIPFYLGGTSLLIVVNVVIEMFQQIQMYLLSGKYSSLMRNNALFMQK